MSERMTDEGLRQFIEDAEDYFRSVDDGSLNSAHDKDSILSELCIALPAARRRLAEIDLLQKSVMRGTKQRDAARLAYGQARTLLLRWLNAHADPDIEPPSKDTKTFLGREES